MCQVKHRDNFGRLLCYVHKQGEHYNLKLVRDGWSPYFEKYGRSRLYHREFSQAESEAQSHLRAIWNPLTNDGGPTRPYDILRPWWSLRGALVDDYRRAVASAPAARLLDVRLDYPALFAAAQAHSFVTVLCDLQQGIRQWIDDGALIWAGSAQHAFNLRIPNLESSVAQRIVQLVQLRYGGTGRRNYVYVSGIPTLHHDIPVITLTRLNQLSDFPPGG